MTQWQHEVRDYRGEDRHMQMARLLLLFRDSIKVREDAALSARPMLSSAAAMLYEVSDFAKRKQG